MSKLHLIDVCNHFVDPKDLYVPGSREDTGENYSYQFEQDDVGQGDS
jgi:hypothetical protein